MSVWNDASYNIDPLCFLLRQITLIDVDSKFVKKLGNIVITEEDVANSNGVLIPGNLGENLALYPRLAPVIEPLAFTRKKRNSEAMLKQFAEHEVYSGISAVYQVFSAMFQGRMQWPREINKKWLRDFTKQFYGHAMLASYSSPKDIRWGLEEMDVQRSWYKHMIKYENFAEGFDHLNYVHGHAQYMHMERKAEISNEPIPRVPKRLIDFGKTWSVYKAHSLVFLEEDTIVSKKLYVLTPKDIKRLHQMCSSLADMEMYFGIYDRSIARENLYSTYRRILELIIQAMHRNVRPNEVARACDVAYGLMVAKYAEDFWTRSTEEQAAKISRENLNEIIDVIGLTKLFMQHPVAEAFELSKIYKFLPAPDFNIFTAFNEQKKKHYNKNPFAVWSEVNQKKFEGMEPTVAEFKLYQKFQMIKTFSRRHGRLPGSVKQGVEEKNWHTMYPFMQVGSLNWRDVDDIDMFSSHAYKAHPLDVNPSLKDKVLAPDKLRRYESEYEMNESEKHNRSYLVKYLTSEYLPTPEHTRDMYEKASGKKHNQILVALKPESKKPSARNFYICDYKTRQMLSEFEESLADYLKFKTGSFAGLSFTDTFNKMVDLAGSDEELAGSKYISFPLT